MNHVLCRRLFVLILAVPALAQHPALKKPELARETAPPRYVAVLEFENGAVVEIEVHRDWAPLAADRFYNLVKIGFFDGCAFFRVVSNFIVQWGIPSDPAVTRAWQNASMKDDERKKSNKAGTIAFASRMVPGTRTTQVFINTNDNMHLDGYDFAPFGKVIKGYEAVKDIYAGYGERPSQARIETEGDRYLDRDFPKLDKIKKATIQGLGRKGARAGQGSPTGLPVPGSTEAKPVPPGKPRRPSLADRRRITLVQARLSQIYKLLTVYKITYKRWPQQSGPAFLMELVRSGVIDKTKKDLEVLFDPFVGGPDDDLSNVTPSGIGFTGPDQNTGLRFSPAMRNADEYAIVAQKVPAATGACDGHGICVLTAAGSTRFIPASKFPGGKIVIGPNSPIKLLRSLHPGQ